MSKRTLTVSFLTAGLTVGVIAGAVGPAAAQGNPVGGSGNVYYLAGAGSTGGNAQDVLAFGDPGDEVYFGDWDNDGTDTPMVNRNGVFYVANKDGKTVDVFAYGNPGDKVLVGDWDGKNGDSLAVVRTEQGTNHFFVKNDVKKSGTADSEFFYGTAGDDILVGDWDGDGTDTLAVRRGNRFFVKNDIDTGVADYEFVYGDPGDRILVGNWDGDTSAEDAEFTETTDTIMVQRRNHFFVKNDTTTGVADYDFIFGDAGDTILVGDWAYPAMYGDDPDTAERETDHRFPGRSGDHADQLAVRRGNGYHLSDEVWLVGMEGSSSLATMREFAYGDATDTAFTAQLDNTFELEDGTQETLYGDGLAVRRR